MVIQRIKSFLKYIIVPKNSGIYQYKDYEEYKKVQVEGNLKKLDRSFVVENNIKFLSEYIKKTVPKVKFGLCHGTRQGKEQEWFTKYLDVPVIGTEISHTATQFPNTIEWDFHDVKPEWINKTDFIYSNSFDHSYKPKECLNSWMSCITKKGIIILEWTPEHIGSSELDPFGATLEEYKILINEKYNIKEILDSPNNKALDLNKMRFLIISHK